MSVVAKDLNFSYRTYTGDVQVLFDINLNLKAGSRVLLIGANGAGKSTLLRILAGQHLPPAESTVETLGISAFHQTLGLSGVSFLGNSWTRTISYAGHSIPYQNDIPVVEMMSDLQNEFKERRDHLYDILEIDPTWRMHQISDGQRRRVQIMLGLLRPFKIMLIDEMTVDLDLLARKEFLNFLTQESEKNGATIIYATHILDGMDGWANHLCFMDKGQIIRQLPNTDVAVAGVPIYNIVLNFLTEMRNTRRVERKKKEKKKEEVKEIKGKYDDVLGFSTGRMSAYGTGF